MNNTMRNVFAWLGAGAVAGILYWSGYIYGLKAETDYFHSKCKVVSVLKFSGDKTPYLCMPPPQQQKKGPTYDKV
ncbi:MAG: hypothetical protein OCD76_07285 [Reichenbachiella sp.]